VYVPGVLAEGVISPFEASIVKPAVDEYIPPVVPVCVTGLTPADELQKGEPG
jgi:hypothetical protein